MKKDELLYEYALDSAKRCEDAKKEIRNRTNIIFTFWVPIEIGIATASMSFSNQFSNFRTHFFIFALILLIMSFVFFVLIVAPQEQKIYWPTQLFPDLAKLENDNSKIKDPDGQVINIL